LIKPHDRLTETQCALRAYKLTTGKYPAALQSLVPAYLPDVPLDPYSNLQPLKYKLTGHTYLLYSIGPDGVDNGGKPMAKTTFGQPTPKTGDIVAGINNTWDY
jgi:hypothetical protein